MNQTASRKRIVDTIINTFLDIRAVEEDGDNESITESSRPYSDLGRDSLECVIVAEQLSSELEVDVPCEWILWMENTGSQIKELTIGEISDRIMSNLNKRPIHV